MIVPTKKAKIAVVGVHDETLVNDSDRFVRFLCDPKNDQAATLWESIHMNLRLHLPILAAAIPLLVSACNRGENGGGVFAGRTPTLMFAKESGSGCGDVFLYKATEDKREYLLVSADKQLLNLPELGSKIFDLAQAPEGLLVTIELWSRASKHTPYCNCVSEGELRETTWNAKSGKVTITIHEALDPDGPMRTRRAPKFENVVFEDDSGRKTTLGRGDHGGRRRLVRGLSHEAVAIRVRGHHGRQAMAATRCRASRLALDLGVARSDRWHTRKWRAGSFMMEISERLCPRKYPLIH